jgi:phosphoribulokinase
VDEEVPSVPRTAAGYAKVLEALEVILCVAKEDWVHRFSRHQLLEAMRKYVDAGGSLPRGPRDGSDANEKAILDYHRYLKGTFRDIIAMNAAAWSDFLSTMGAGSLQSVEGKHCDHQHLYDFLTADGCNVPDHDIMRKGSPFCPAAWNNSASRNCRVDAARSAMRVFRY